MQQNQRIKTKTIIIAAAVFLVLIAGTVTAYHFLRPRGQEGPKAIHINVIADGITTKSVDIHTDAAYLRQALEEKELIKGVESTYGLMVTTVDGRAADDAKQEWWCFTKSGEALNTGVDDTPIEDGDIFEITLVVGYDG